MFRKLIYIFLISMVPIIELRGAIPLASTEIGGPQVEFWLAALVAIAGNFLPAPFLMIFLDKLIEIFSKTKLLGPLVRRFVEKAQDKAAKIGRYELLGLMLIVAIPLPGTGAWTGSAVASILKLPRKRSLFMIFLGLIISASVMVVISYCLPDLFVRLFSRS
ncbi:MAG: small multi-drug export protein [Clostridia bacterium]|nr:small multi-drug export protein [Clostridia bacterium]